MIDPALGLGGLFLAAFLSATLLPGASEPLFIALLFGGGEPVLATLVAGSANTLGSVVNWVAGRSLLRFRDRRWFPASPRALERSGRLFQRYGLWTLPFAFLPIVGDALTVAAGMARVPLAFFVPLVALGKFARYAVLALLTLGWPSS